MPRIPLPAALLFSVILHAAAVLPPLFPPPRAVPPAPILELRLPRPEPLDVPAPPPERMSTRPEPPAAAHAPPPNASQTPSRGRRLQEAQAALLKHLLYPPEAVARGLEGEAIVLLQLDDAGRVLAVEIAKGSGHALLDGAALDAARRLGALPGHPRQLLLPVRFRLD